jgi:hypothetical protein
MRAFFVVTIALAAVFAGSRLSQILEPKARKVDEVAARVLLEIELVLFRRLRLALADGAPEVRLVVLAVQVGLSRLWRLRG